MSDQYIAELRHVATERRPSRWMSFLAYHSSVVDGITIHYKSTANYQAVGFVPPALPNKNAGLPDLAPSWQDQPLRSGRLMFAIAHGDSVSTGEQTIRLAQIAVFDPRVAEEDYYRSTCGFPNQRIIQKGDRLVMLCGNCRDELGRVTDVMDNGWVRVSQPCPFNAPGWVYNSSTGNWIRILTFLIYPADYDFTPNVLIAEPTWVTAEHCVSADQMPDPAPVKAFMRSGPQGQPDYWFGGRVQELPLLLDPGWYAFRSQDATFGEDEGSGTVGDDRYSYRQNGFVCPFTLRYERPKLYFDCGAQLYSHSFSSTLPDERRISRNALIAKSGTDGYKVLALGEGGISGSEGAVAVNKLNVSHKMGSIVAPRWNLSSDVYAVEDESLSRLLERRQEEPFAGYLIGTIRKSTTGEIHFAETELEPHWRATGIEVMHAAPCESEALPANYDGPGIMDLFAYSGYAMIKPGSVIRLADSSNPASGECYLVLDNNDDQPYYRQIPIDGQPQYEAWTRLSIFGANLRKVLVQKSEFVYTEEIEFNRDDFVGKRIFVLEGYRYRARWQVWDGNAIHTVHECICDTGEIPEGSELRYAEEHIPQGEKYTVEWRNDRLPYEQVEVGTDASGQPSELVGNHVALIKLNQGDLDDGARVFLGNGQELTVEEKELPPPQSLWQVPAESNRVYLCCNLGEGRDEAWLVFHPAMANRDVWVRYSYWSRELHISHFADSEGQVYACEAGSGKWLKYLPATKSCELVSQVKAGGTGIVMQPVADNSGNIWAITSPGGLLAKFGRSHSGHVETADFKDANFAAAVAELAQSHNAITFSDPAGNFHFAPRAASRNAVRYLSPEEILMPGVDVQYQPGTESVRIDYHGGSVGKGRTSRELRLNLGLVASRAHAQMVCDELFAAANAGKITLNCVFLPDVALGSRMGIPAALLGESTGFVIGTVIRYIHDHRKQSTSLTLVRESNSSVSSDQPQA
jgi:hypothetical protein